MARLVVGHVCQLQNDKSDLNGWEELIAAVRVYLSGMRFRRPTQLPCSLRAPLAGQSLQTIQEHKVS